MYVCVHVQLLKTVSAGEVLLSIELMPKKTAESNDYAAGLGRSDPNTNPFLPTPLGRFDPSRLLDPIYLLQANNRTIPPFSLQIQFTSPTKQ
jgi:hypothetical protein